jgi:dTDP-4-amino-4,6-dideoxygalactose transaminase
MNMKKINVLKPKFRTEEILESIKECLDKGWTGMGFKTNEFEEEWGKYTGLNNSHFISSNTVGLHLALNVFRKQYNWKDGDEIITTPLTFISTNHSIMYENFKPVFADVDESLCLDPESIKSKITSKTKAIIYVGIGGNTGKLKEVQDICKKYNLKLILDAAHMAGTKIKNTFQGMGYTSEHVGKEADVVVFSFQAVKNLPTADSGMICFKDNKLDKLARKLSWLGINKDTFNRSSKGSYKWKYDVEDIGFKYHGNSIMAAIGLTQLKYLDEDNDYRNFIAQKYIENLKNIKEIKIIYDSPLIDKSSKHLFQIRVNKNKRDKIIESLYNKDIYPGVHYIDNTTYSMYNYAFGSCPNAHRYSDELITLPIHLDITLEDINKICNVLKNKLT